MAGRFLRNGFGFQLKDLDLEKALALFEKGAFYSRSSCQMTLSVYVASPAELVLMPQTQSW